MMAKLSVLAFFATSTAVIIYLILYVAVPAPALTVVLNSVFVGSFLAVIVTYWRLIFSSVTEWARYDRARHYVIGVALLWAAVVMLMSNSIFIRSTYEQEYIPASSFLGTTARFLAILAAVIQVTAPDFGDRFDYGAARKSLIYGIFIGGLTAAIVLYLQRASL